MRPILLLDFDDVICLNRPYGGYDVASPDRPADLWEKLWYAPAVALLEGVVTELHPHVVLTTSWLRFMQLDDAKALFQETRMPWLADALHPAGEAVQNHGWTRLDAVDAWLAAHRNNEPYAIIDDSLSGSGLAGSSHDRAGRLVLCQVDVGLQPHHVPLLRRALST